MRGGRINPLLFGGFSPSNPPIVFSSSNGQNGVGKKEMGEAKAFSFVKMEAAIAAMAGKTRWPQTSQLHMLQCLSDLVLSIFQNLKEKQLSFIDLFRRK